jgi:toxoflavin synthase
MSKPDQYDVIGELYERVKQLPVGIPEQTTILSAVPALAGKSLLDIACGTGFYPRLFKGLGAERVVGVDASVEMIHYAQSVETANPLGISYDVHDATTLPVLGNFEVATAIWLFGYAQDENQLVDMARNICANLTENGVFVALCPNPDISWETATSRYQKYGLLVAETFTSGARMGCTVKVLAKPSFTFESFFWPREILERSLRLGGFDELIWHPVTVSDEAVTEFGADFWADFLENPTFAVVTMRPASPSGP